MTKCNDRCVCHDDGKEAECSCDGERCNCSVQMEMVGFNNLWTTIGIGEDETKTGKFVPLERLNDCH